MGLDLLLSIRSGKADTSLKARGDILVAKPLGSKWGNMERKVQCIVSLTDKEIALISDVQFRKFLQALDKEVSDAPDHVKVLPSLVYIVEENGTVKMAQRSQWNFNVSSLDPSKETDLLDIKKDVLPINLVSAKVNECLSVKPEPEIIDKQILVKNGEILANKIIGEIISPPIEEVVKGR